VTDSSRFAPPRLGPNLVVHYNRRPHSESPESGEQIGEQIRPNEVLSPHFRVSAPTCKLLGRLKRVNRGKLSKPPSSTLENLSNGHQVFSIFLGIGKLLPRSIEDWLASYWGWHLDLRAEARSGVRAADTDTAPSAFRNRQLAGSCRRAHQLKSVCLLRKSDSRMPKCRNSEEHDPWRSIESRHIPQ
jgi:hypothetical protein